MQGRIDRRRFLCSLLAFIWVLPATKVIAFPVLFSAERQPLARKLTTIFTRPESARVIGRTYLKLFPAEADLHLLVSRFHEDMKVCNHQKPETDPARLKAYLAMRQRKDFDEGNVVNVGGWLLSKTECRLCAIACLLG